MKTQIKKKNQRGQVGETLTWIVATIIILIVLIFFIFGASLLGGTKKVGVFREALTSGETLEGNDIFLKKSLFTYVTLTSETEKTLLDKRFERLDEEGKFDISYTDTRKEILLNYNKR
ncbi:MAG: hypothetical protein Q8Q04_00420 [archaeon]|nr:hypothetical protein [archaeon]